MKVQDIAHKRWLGRAHIASTLVIAGLTACGGGGSGSTAGGSAPIPSPAPQPVATAAAVSLDQTSVDIPSVEYGTRSVTKTITVTNSGDANLTFSGLATDRTDISIAGGSCAVNQVVVAKGSCTIDVAFNPTSYSSYGKISATLTLNHNAGTGSSAVAIHATSTVTRQSNAGALPAAVAADCPRLTSTTLPTPDLKTSDARYVSDLLQAVSPNQGYRVFARMPDIFMWFARNSAFQFNEIVMGTALHETNHNLDQALSTLCRQAGNWKLVQDGVVYTLGFIQGLGQTKPYGIVKETIPASYIPSVANRYQSYIIGLGERTAQDFAILLEELNAYTGAAEFETRVQQTPAAAAVAFTLNDNNAMGMNDFMVYLVSYLKAARLSYPPTYNTIKSDPATVQYIQAIWSKAETVLNAVYPQTLASGNSLTVMNKTAISAIYTSGLIAELDAIGIKHMDPATLNSTYLK